MDYVKILMCLNVTCTGHQYILTVQQLIWEQTITGTILSTMICKRSQ